METENIKDFSDLGKAEYFKYNGVKFAVPPLTRESMTDLVRINKEIRDHIEKKPKKENAESIDQAKDKNPEDDTDQMMDEMDSLLGLQQKFVLAGVRRCDGEAFKVMELGEIKDWPIKLMRAAIKIINEAMTMKGEEVEDQRPT